MDYEEATRAANELLSQAIPELKKPLSIPDWKGADLSRVRREETNLRKSRDASASVIEDSARITKESTEAEKIAIKAKGQAESDKAYADQAQAQTIAGIHEAINRAVEITPTDIAVQAEKTRQTRAVVEQQRDEIRSMQSVGVLDNPLEWLVNQVQLPAKIEPYNRNVDAVNAMESALANAITTARTAGEQNVKAVPSISAAQAKATADAHVAVAAKQVADADQALARQNVEYATKKFAADLSVAQMTATTTQFEVTQAQQAYQAKITAVQLAENHATRLIKAAQLIEQIQQNDDKAKSRKGIERALAQYDTVMGNPVGMTNILMWEKLPAAHRENMMAISIGSGGSNPLEATINLSNARFGPMIAPNTAKLNAWMQNEVATISKNNQINALDKQNQPGAINQELIKAVNRDKENPSNSQSIFHELSPKEMIAAGQIKPDSPLGEVLKPFAEQKVAPTTEIVVAAIVNKFKNPSVAGAVISDYYRANINLRNSTMNYKLFKVDAPTDYPVRMKTGFLGSTQYNLADSAEATKYAVQYEIKYGMPRAEIGIPNRDAPGGSAGYQSPGRELSTPFKPKQNNSTDGF